MRKRLLPGCTLILALAALVFVVGPASAATKTLGPVCGQLVSGSVTLTKNLKCDGDGLTVNANGTTIDLAGYVIVCLTSCDNGIYNDAYSDLTVKDSGKKGKPTKKGFIGGFYYGIYLDNGVQGALINGVTIEDVTEGVRLDSDGFGNTIKNNAIFGAGAGINLDLFGCGGGGNTVSGNTVVEAEVGINNNNDCGSSNGHNVFSNNNVYFAGAGYYDYHGFMESWQNNVAIYTYYGLEGDHTCLSMWDGNNAKFSIYDGFDMWSEHDCPVTVTNNTATKTSDGPGFYFEKLNDGSDGSTISGNTSSKNDGPGFVEYRNYYSDLTGNTATKNGAEGFFLNHTFEETITGNTATGNGVSVPAAGFYVSNNYSPGGCDGGGQCQVSDLSGNTATGNSFFGIYAEELISGSPNAASGNSGPGQCYNVACAPSLAPVHPSGPYARANATFGTHATRWVSKDK